MNRLQCTDAVVTEEQIQRYLQALDEKGRSPGTLQTYRRCLSLFRAHCSQVTSSGPDLLLLWQSQLLASGYHPSTINTCLSVAHRFLGFLEVQGLHPPSSLEITRVAPTPELNRREYMRLLLAAKTAGKERTYLLIKLFALTGLAVQDVPRVTAEVVKAGHFSIRTAEGSQSVSIPACLQAELSGFARRNHIDSGPLFRTRSGKALSRTNVSDAIRALHRVSQVAPEKCNPRCLRKLYLESWAAIERSLRYLAEQTYDRMVEEEQSTVGWEQIR